MTTTAIPAGTFVCEYSGAFVSQRILERKEERKQRLLSSGSRPNSQNESFVTYAIEINHKGVDYFVDSEYVAKHYSLFENGTVFNKSDFCS